MKKNGKIISVEGADKAGKATQVRKIMEYLRERGIPAETIDFPQYKSFFGQLPKSHLNGEYGDIAKLPPRLTMLPFALDRLKFQPQIQEWMGQGKCIVFDRYTYSNVFSIARLPREKWESEIRWLEEMEFDQLGLARPDYNFYLYLDPKIGYDMRNQGLKEYQNGKPDAHESNLPLLQNVAKVYKTAALLNPTRWTFIDEMAGARRLTIDEVFALIKVELDKLFSCGQTLQKPFRTIPDQQRKR